MDPDFKGKPHVLLVEHFGRTWSIAKGDSEKGESLVETAVREVQEEVNLLPTDYELVNKVNKSDNNKPLKVTFERESKGGPKEMKVITQFMGLTTVPQEQLVIATPEKSITDYKWCTFKQAKKRLHKPDYKALVKLFTLGMWSYSQEQSMYATVMTAFSKHQYDQGVSS